MKTSKNFSFLITILLLFCTMLGENVSAQESGYRWGKWSEGQSNQGTGNMMDAVIDSYIDSTGNTYIFGQFGKDARLGENGPYICPMDSTTGFRNGNIHGVYLAKIDSSGNILWYKSARGGSVNSPCTPWNMIVKDNKITIAFDFAMGGEWWNWFYFFDTLLVEPLSPGQPRVGDAHTYFATFDFDGNRVGVHDIRLMSSNTPYRLGLYSGRFCVDDNNIYIFATTDIFNTDSISRPYLIIDGDPNKILYMQTRIENGERNILSTSKFIKLDSDWNFISYKDAITNVEGWHPKSVVSVTNLIFYTVVTEDDALYVNGHLNCSDTYYMLDTISDTFQAKVFLDSIHYLRVDNLRDFSFMPFLIRFDKNGEIVWMQQVYTESPNDELTNFYSVNEREGIILDGDIVYNNCTANYFSSSHVVGTNFYLDSTHTIPMVNHTINHTLITSYNKQSGAPIDFYYVDTVDGNCSTSYYILGDEIILNTAYSLLRKTELCKINKITKEVTKTSPISYCWTNIESKNMFINSNGWVFRGETGSEPRVFDSIFVGNYQKASVMTFFYDSTLDQRIKPCPRVDSLWGDSIVRHTAVLYWHGRYGQVGYEVAYIPEGGNWDNATTLETSDTSASITLPNDQCYQFRIRGLCGGRREAYGPWSDPVTLCPKTMGIECVESPSTISLTPNPAKDKVAVTLLPPIAPSDCTLTLADASGREILRFAHPDTHLQIDLTTLPAGLYLVTLTTPKGSNTQKLVVE